MKNKIGFLAIVLAAVFALPFAPVLAAGNDEINKLASDALNNASTKITGAGGSSSSSSAPNISLGDRLQGAAGIAAAGIGGMQLASGISQNMAEEEGRELIENYQKTWQCGVGSAVQGRDGVVNWVGGKYIGAGEVGVAPSVAGMSELLTKMQDLQSRIRAAKGEIDMVLTEEEQRTFSANGLYGNDANLAEGGLNNISTGGGNTSIAVGAGLATGGMMLASGQSVKTSIGTGMIAGGTAGAVVADSTAGRIAGGATAAVGAGAVFSDELGITGKDGLLSGIGGKK